MWGVPQPLVQVNIAESTLSGFEECEEQSEEGSQELLNSRFSRKAICSAYPKMAQPLRGKLRFVPRIQDEGFVFSQQTRNFATARCPLDSPFTLQDGIIEVELLIMIESHESLTN